MDPANRTESPEINPDIYGERIVTSINGVWEKNEMDYYLTSLTKIN